MGISIWHWVILVALFVVFAWPASRILKRLGISPWWALLAPVTPLNLIGLWILAYIRWPIDRR